MERMKEAYNKHVDKIRSKVGSNNKTPQPGSVNHPKKDTKPSSPEKATKKMNWSRKLFNKDSEGSNKGSFVTKESNTVKNLERAINAHRDFTSFGSKLPTTPSTSKRSSNDWEKEKKSGVIEENNEENLNQSINSTPFNKGNRRFFKISDEK